MALTPGTRLGPYEIIAPLGAGGMGEVFRARDTLLKRDVAVKVISSSDSTDPDRLRRFQQEAEAAAALNHPNILSVYSVGQHDGTPYIVTELLQGESLRAKISEGILSVRKAVDYATQIVTGLSAAHEKGIIHRDLKPENIFVTEDDRVKILDFGLAKLLAREPAAEYSIRTVDNITREGQVLGTVGYMAPEQIRGRVADARADIFAFGTVLFEMLTGKAAFRRDSLADTQSAVLKEDPAEFEALNVKAPAALERIVRRCLEKLPEQRFQNSLDLRFALEAFSGMTSGIAVALPESPEDTFLNSRKLVIASVLFGAFCVSLLALHWSSFNQPQVENVIQLTNDGQSKLTVNASSLVTDGSRLYFNEGSSGNWLIAQVSTSGGQTIPVATTVADPQISDISPDLSTLMATSGEADLAPLWYIPLPAGNPQPIGELRARFGTARITSDGKRILYSTESSINVADRDGSNSHQLVQIPGSLLFSPGFSPDGKRLRFTAWSDNLSAALWEATAQGENPHELLKNWPQSDRYCCGRWTSDGRYYVFQAQAQNDERWDLWAIPETNGFSLASKKPVRLTAGPLSYQVPLPNHDNTSIFAIGSLRRGELAQFDRNRQQFTPFLGSLSATAVQFSRDGKWMVYISYPDHTLWRSGADGHESLQLTHAPDYAMYPSMSPDGTRVSFNLWNTRTGMNLYITQVHGGIPRKVADNAGASDWSPDGKLLAFESIVRVSEGKPEMFEIKIMDTESNKISSLPEGLGKAGVLWAAPEKLVAFTESADKLMLFDLKTQRWSDLAEGNFASIVRANDEQYIYAEQIHNGVPTIEKIRLLDGHIEKILDLSGVRRVVEEYENTWFGISPDGSVVLTRDVGTKEIYSLKIRWP